MEERRNSITYDDNWQSVTEPEVPVIHAPDENDSFTEYSAHEEAPAHRPPSRQLLITVQLVLCAVFAALTAVCAQITIPIGAVPISLSLLPPLLCAALLSPRYAVLSMAVYLLMGLCGLPVFSGMSGGPGKLFGVTGGYIIGYIPLAWLTGLIYKKYGSTARMPVRLAFMIIGMIVGNIALYVIGTAWFMVITGMDLGASLAACVIPFIPGNFIKMAAVCFIAPPVENAIRRTRPSRAVA